MARYYAGKRKSSSRGWLKRNIRRAKPIYNMAKSRYAPSGKLNVSKIQSDINYVKNIATTAYGLLNTEKKRSEFNFYNQAIGQVNSTNGSGHWYQEITCTPSQGTGYGNRMGSSISLRAMCLNMQLYQQSSAQTPMKIIFYVIQTSSGKGFSIGEFLQYNKYLFALNSSAVYDTHCQRDPDYFKDYKVLRKKIVRLSPDQYSGQTQVKDVQIKLNFGKYGKHIRFNDNTASTTNNQFYILAVADCGNKDTTNSSTLNGIPITGTSTGAWLQVDGVSYFIDN